MGSPPISPVHPTERPVEEHECRAAEPVVSRTSHGTATEVIMCPTCEMAFAVINTIVISAYTFRL